MNQLVFACTSTKLNQRFGEVKPLSPSDFFINMIMIILTVCSLLQLY
jgi:hypothetical protein